MRVAGRDLEVRSIDATRAGVPPVVMLHEGLGSVALWKDFPDRLAQRTGARVIAYSRYGYGASDVFAEPRDVTYMHDEARVLADVLGALHVERPVLFGHSDGASIALLYAGEPANEPAGLILEAPHVFVEDVSVRSIAAAKQAFETTDLAARLARYHRDPAATFRGWNDIWLDARFRSWNIEAALAGIRCPVLLLQGVDDEYGTRAQLDAIAAAVSGVRVQLLERCGHSPHRDRADAVLDAADRFLRSLAVAHS